MRFLGNEAHKPEISVIKHLDNTWIKKHMDSQNNLNNLRMDHEKSDREGGGGGHKSPKNLFPQEIINKKYIFLRILAKKYTPKEDLCR